MTDALCHSKPGDLTCCCHKTTCANSTVIKPRGGGKERRTQKKKGDRKQICASAKRFGVLLRGRGRGSTVGAEPAGWPQCGASHVSLAHPTGVPRDFVNHDFQILWKNGSSITHTGLDG